MATLNTGYHAQDGQEVHPQLANTEKNGTGTWYVPLVDSEGRYAIALVAGTAVMGKVRLVDADGNEVTASSAIKTNDQFSGTVYRAGHNQKDNNARRFVNSPLKVRDTIIKVTDAAQYFGDGSDQTLKVEADGSLSFSKLDVSSLWFKNVTAGQNGTVNILATRE